MANHYTFGIGQPHTETDDELTPVGLSPDGTSLVSGDGTAIDFLTHLSAIPQVPIVLFGDSRIAQCAADSGTSKSLCNRGFFFHLQNSSKGSFDLKNVAGVGGDTLALGLARFDNAVGGPLFGNGAAPGVSPYLPASAKGVLITWLGANDINTGVTLATMQTTAQQIMAKAKALNCLHIWVNEPPAGSAQGWTAAQNAKIVAWNRWLLSQSVLVIDAYSLAINPTSATMLPASNMMNDNAVHPSNLLGKLIGEAIWAKISALIQTPNILPSSVTQVISYNSAVPQYQVLPLLQTNVAASGSTFGSLSGTMPTGATFVGVGSATVVSDATTAAASGFGNAWQADITFASASDVIVMNLPTSAANFTGGETIFAACNVELTGPSGAALTTADNVKVCKIQLDTTDAAAVSAVRTGGLENSGDVAQSGNINGVLRTPPVTLSAGVPTTVRAKINIQAAGAGGCRVKISRAAIWAV